MLATGGCGQVYRYTTNPVVATGDGYAIAHRAGVTLADMEFVQFHPTALDTPENPLALISEAVRGEGAILVNSRGVRFMRGVHATRRARAARRRGARDLPRAADGPVSISTRASSARGSRSAFPASSRSAQARGIDPRKDLIPVTPAAHYMMGGVVTDLRGRSSATRLYAVGEVARTGVHGANRLASNSLLEGLVFAERVARDLAESHAPRRRSRRRRSGRCRRSPDRGAAQVAADDIRDRDVGVRRHRAHGTWAARRRSSELDEIGARLPAGATEELNMLQTAQLIVEARCGARSHAAGTIAPTIRARRRTWRGRHIEL